MSSLSIGSAGSVVVGSAIALVAVLLLLRLEVLPPLAGFGLFMALWVGGGITGLVLGLLRLRAVESRPEGWMAILLALVLLAPLAMMLSGIRRPAIHDITTSFEDPPAFAAALEANDGRDLSYPEGPADLPELQRAAYPDVRAARLPLAPAEALERSRQVAEELGWSIVAIDATTGRLEATDISALFRFVDDIVLRVRADGNGSRVDLRSTSRVGRSDLGANAARIRAFVERIES